MKKTRARHRRMSGESAQPVTPRHMERVRRREGRTERQTVQAPRQHPTTPVHQERESLTRELRKEAEQIMLQMEKIGAYIARLRKANGMTQGKLAERLNVSHQAVSNWERGDSLPDASQWIPLSRVLGTSVDLLLYGGELPEDMEGDFPEEAVEEKDSDIVFETEEEDDEDEDEEDDEDEDEEEEEDEEDEEDEDDEEEDEDEDEDDGEDDDEDETDENDYWKQAVRLAPFLSRQGMEKLVKKACESGHPDWSRILRLAPFLDRTTLDYLADEACKGEEPDWDVIRRLAPFLSRSTLDSLAERAYQEEQPNWHILRRLAPFLSRSALDRIVERASEGDKPDLRAILSLAPFLSKDALSRLLRAACQGERPDWATIRRLAPHLPQELVDELVSRAMEGKPLSDSEDGQAEGAGRQGASAKRRKAARDWASMQPEDVMEAIQEEVLNAMDIGQENLRQIKDAVFKGIDRFFNQDADR